MRQSKRLLPWLAIACLIGAAHAAAGPAIVDSSSRQLLQTANTQANPSCVCPMHYSPVCGKDGKTHGNACSARCRGIEVVHMGECTTQSSGGGSGRKPRCACAKLFAPVCSTAKKTYANACEAKCAGAQVQSAGACPDSSSAGTITSDSSSNPPIACNCEISVKEVCGENGKSYTNECLATCAGTKVASQGPCKAAQATKAKCVCAAMYDPVCGQNGKTFSSPCEANCEGIAIAARGLCPTPPGAKPQGGPAPAGAAVGGSCVCPMVWKPVCTANGKTRGNRCEAKCRGETVAKEGECEAAAAVTMSDAASPKASTQTKEVTSKASLAAELAEDNSQRSAAALPLAGGIPMKPPRRANCACMALYAPVCGKDGNTYSNKCEAGCHDMKVAREGECDTSTDVIDGAASNSGVRPGCNFCPSVFEPVCGQDGKTYGNECEALCRGRTKVAHEGRCKGSGGSNSDHTGISGLDRCLEACAASDTDHKPVCGVDRKRYKSSCAAHCHKVDIAYPGDCKGECSACPHQWFPYCANSGQYGPSTFANCCYAKCNNVAIIKQVLHAGVCLDKCGKCDPTLERPLCCKGRTYKNGCYAKCNEEDTNQCSLGRCSATTHVEKGIACLLGPCNVQCKGDKFENKPVCGSDGMTYPSQCSLMCSQHVAIVHEGKCGTCAPNQLPGGFPFCESADRMGVQPVCGKDNITYRNSIAASAAHVDVVNNGTCTANQCGEENEVCFISASGNEQSSCCTGYVCAADSTSSIQLEANIAMKLAGGSPGVCRKASATLSA